MSANPFEVVKALESDLCAYTGARYAVTVNSCTMALLLAVAWHVELLKEAECGEYFTRLNVSIPKHTYVSVPQSIIHAGLRPVYRDEEWIGQYQLQPLPVWDCARRFTSGMYEPGQFMCVSFHASKILGDSQGGAILHDNEYADNWLRHARFDGRTEGVPPKHDDFDMVGWHCYMSPDVAARLLHKLSVLPMDNAPLPNDEYPDLSTFKAFR
jgi:dTDP-4-amino-4,6-dideoxygalactose transaminase